ncbi:MAG: DsbA family protein [Sphingomonas sp.]|uniref:DsbA family protein n=1 Tax=Sphingomonas sp. TaxID=28214 RepID=UPI003F7F2B8B
MTGFLSSRAALPIVAALAALLGAGATWLVQRPTNGAQIRDYLLTHPEVLPEAMQKLQEREAAEQSKQTGAFIAANRDRIFPALGSAWAGNPNGDVTVVEYLDYNCGYCRASLPILDKLVASDPQVKVVFRELPVLSEESKVAARYAVVAAKQGKYRALHDALYAGGPLSDASMDAALQKAGLDPAQTKAAAKAPEVTGIIENNLAMAAPLGMSGTPTWVIGDKVLSGMQPLEAMQAAVAAARRK